jgi:hypothetical protein
MATVSQFILQKASGVKYVGGEAILPQEPLPAPPKALAIAEVLTEGTDLGAVKVENGKLVLDMDDFNPDFGIYDGSGGSSFSRS